MSSNNNSTSNREIKEQIPTEYNEEQTLRTLRKQSQISGEGRDKTITDIPKAAAIGQVLKDLEFPADKNKIIHFVQQQRSKKPESQEILPLLEKIEEKQYENVSDVTMAAGLVQ
jgi:hypothetical protein